MTSNLISHSPRTLAPGSLALWHRVYPTSPGPSSLNLGGPLVAPGQIGKLWQMRVEMTLGEWQEKSKIAEQAKNLEKLKKQAEKAKTRRRNKTAKASRKKNR